MTKNVEFVLNSEVAIYTHNCFHWSNPGCHDDDIYLTLPSILKSFLPSQSLYVPYLGTQLDHTDIEIMENGVPHCAPQNGNTLLHAFADVARQQTAATGDELGYIMSLLLAMVC